jgi:hypothetical protein
MPVISSARWRRWGISFTLTDPGNRHAGEVCTTRDENACTAGKPELPEEGFQAEPGVFSSREPADCFFVCARPWLI